MDPKETKGKKQNPKLSENHLILLLTVSVITSTSTGDNISAHRTLGNYTLTQTWERDVINRSLRASSLFGSHARFILGESGERPREDWGGCELGRACHHD